ncbi:hypothetical protein ES703_85632 [subsurface metagenome]
MTKTYRPASSYVGSTEEARKAQLENLLRGRARRAKKAFVKPPSLKDPAYETDIIRFAEEQFYIPETRKPIVLEPFQKKDILKPLFYEEDRPTMALVGQTKKSGKSTLAAMVVAWVLFCGEDFSETYIAARDFQQGQWIIFSKLVKAIEMNPNMLLNVNITKDAVERPVTGSVVRCLPTEISAAGLNPNLVIFDELWSYDLESMTRFFEEMTSVPTRKHPLILIVTYAGYDTDEENLLYSLYKKGLEGKDPTFFFFWDHKNRMPWQTKQYLKQQRGRLRPGTYKRLHLNEWTSGDEPFIDMTEWDACIDRKHSPILPDKKASLIVGVDIGISHDCSAVVAVTRNESKIKLACHRAWQPTKKSELDLEESVEAYIKDLARDYTIKEVRFDPYQFARSSQTLAKLGIRMVEFPQTQDRLTSMSQNLYDLIKGGGLVLYRDKQMRDHAQKATAKETARGWRIVKKKASHKIDLIIALAMAALGATQIKESRPGRVYIGTGEPMLEVDQDYYNARREPGKGHVYIG